MDLCNESTDRPLGRRINRYPAEVDGYLYFSVKENLADWALGYNLQNNLTVDFDINNFINAP